MEIQQIIAGLPAGAIVLTTTEVGPIVLAEGELTGHAHRVTGAAVLVEYQGQRYLVTDGAPVALSHEEHGADIETQPVYHVRQQREMSLEGEWRKVID